MTPHEAAVEFLLDYVTKTSGAPHVQKAEEHLEAIHAAQETKDSKKSK